MITRDEKIILNALLDKYEKSKSFTGDNKVTQTFSVKITGLFPQYGDQSNFEIFQEVNEAIDRLVRKQLICAEITKGRVCSAVSLNSDAIDAAYICAGRLQKRAVNDAVLLLLEAYMNKNVILNAFCEAQAERIRQNKTIEYFNQDLRAFEKLLIALDAVIKVETETFIRDFSVKVFKDSKVFDALSKKAVKILFDYGDFPEKDQVLETLNLVKNPTYVNFKGAGIIKLSGQIIDLNRLGSDIAISSSILSDIDRIEITGKSVMTIENLTSFHTMAKADVFYIYLGGFHNTVRREFIKKIHEQNPDVEFVHFGDIDAGGFYIFEHLMRKTGIAFMPYKMDLETLLNYEVYSKKLTENDRNRLKKLSESRFKEVIEYMLEHDCKLEQEAVNLE